MAPPSENFYMVWRARLNEAAMLHDEDDLPSERLLQAVWLHQRLRREQLKTVDGRNVKIFHPGFASTEGGPDFRGAVIQIGDDAPCSGDVEIDVQAGNWHAHGHDRNPNFKSVRLHVVWEKPDVLPSHSRERRLKTEPRTGPPILPLSEVLDTPLHELSLWLESESSHSFPESSRGQCCAPVRELNEMQLTDLLREAAGARFQAKAAHFRARARVAGWEQSLWEGLFRALGYKHNTWPMQHLAEARRHWMRHGNSVFELQARLFGISGLLPHELPRAAGNDYLQRIWDCWWRERDGFADYLLPRAVWRFHGLRPANHPQRRLALAAHWLANADLVQKLEAWCAANLAGNGLSDSLREILEVNRDEFWSWHWTFRSTRLKKPQPLLGAARVTDLAMNVILPWLWIRAVEGKNQKLKDALLQRYFTWPQSQDNSILRLARQRLLDSNRNPFWRNAAIQQGLIQITRDFCGHSDAVCTNCRFPELVNNWRGRAVTERQCSQTAC